MFEASLPTLVNPSIIVSSVLANFLCDACSAVDVSQLIDAANTEISLHVQTIQTFLQAHPHTRCVIVPPLSRQIPHWFSSYLPCFITYLISEVAKIGSVQLQVLSPFVTLPSSFEADGVHLNGEAGLSFIQYLVTGLDQLVPTSSTSTEAGSVSTHLAPAHPFASSSGATGGSSTVPEPGSISAHLTPANLFATSSGNGTSDPNVLQSAVANLASLTGSMRAEITARRLQD